MCNYSKKIKKMQKGLTFTQNNSIMYLCGGLNPTHRGSDIVKTNLKLFDLLKGATGTINSETLIYELIYIYDRYRREGEAERVVRESYNTYNLLNMMMTNLDKFGELFKDVVKDYKRKIFKETNLQPFFNFLHENANSITDLILFDYETSIYNESTPQCISELAIKILETHPGEKVLDIGSFKGSFLANYFKYNNTNHYTGVDISVGASLVARIRLEILNARYEIINKDIFNDAIDGKYEKVFSNYPFMPKLPMNALFNNKNTNIELQSKNSGDWFFIMNLLRMLSNSGTGIAIVSNGCLFKMTDIEIRKHLIDNGYIETIIALPEKIFAYSNIATSLIVFNKSKRNTIKFIDASKLFTSARRVNLIEVEKVLDEYNSNKETEVTRFIDIDSIKENDYNLTTSRYFDSKVELINPTPLEDVILEIIRGYRITAEEIDKSATNLESENTFKILNLSDINNGIINDELTLFEADPKSVEKYILMDGDVIISAKSSKIKTAVVSVKNDERIVASGNLLILRPDKNRINPYYLKLFFDSDKGNKILSSIQTGAVILSINSSQLKKIYISLLDMEEQNKLANKYLAKLDSIKIMKSKLQQLEEELSDIGKDCL